MIYDLDLRHAGLTVGSVNDLLLNLHHAVKTRGRCSTCELVESVSRGLLTAGLFSVAAQVAFETPAPD